MSKKLTQDEFVQKVNDKYNGKFEVIGKYIDATTPIKIKHKSCGTVFPKTPNKITAKSRKCSCPVCDGYKSKAPLIGINDLWTTHPEIAKLLKNPEDGYACSKGTNGIMNFVCPFCHHDIDKPVYEVVEKGYLSCIFCSSGKSYPNRFMANLLDVLKIKFIPEYRIEPYTYRFDFYFTIVNKQYVIEMDGELGHGNKTWGGKPDSKGLEIDAIKDDICRKNDIEVIRIDCKYINHRFEYIKQAVLNSKLNILFDFATINFKDIDKASCSSLVVDIANYWNNGINSYDQFIELTFLSRDTVRRYLKIACDNNYIAESYHDVLKKIRHASNKKIAVSKSHMIMCDQTGDIFVSIKEAQKQMNVFGIRNYLIGKQSYAGKLLDGTKLTWTRLSNEQHKQTIKERAS